MELSNYSYEKQPFLQKMPRHQQEDACGTEANFHGVLGHDLSKRGHWLTRAIDKIYWSLLY